MRDEWFRTWFESDYYLKVYKHRNLEDAEKLVRLIISQDAIKSGGRLLDLGCGAGRHAAIFAGEGFEVFGIDISNNLLKLARRDSEQKGIYLSLMRADLRRIPLRSGFDIVTNLFTTFGYFHSTEENFSIFRSSFELLNQGGIFVFDYLNPIHLSRNLISESREEFDGIFLLQKREISGSRVRKHITLQSGEESFNYCEDVRLYYDDELREGLSEAGFDLIQLYGDYSGAKFEREKSPRFIAICQKS